jgi:hypothetical protein
MRIEEELGDAAIYAGRKPSFARLSINRGAEFLQAPLF